jgi:phosphohistidine swiveling domain-containing protein
VPAVVGVKGVVEILKDGQLIEVDGDLGQVNVIEESADS